MKIICNIKKENITSISDLLTYLLQYIQWFIVVILISYPFRVFAIQDATTLHIKFAGTFVMPTCDAAVYNSNNQIVPSGTILLPSLDSSEATTRVKSSIGDKVIFKIGPVNPKACIDLPLTQYRVDVSASGYSSGNVLYNVANNGPTNIGIEILQQDGSSILNFGDQASQVINPNNIDTSLVAFSAQLYNKTGGAPDKFGSILSVATFTTSYY